MEQTRQIKQFQFYDFYAEILNGLNDESAGRIARLMCEYVFTDNTVADIKDDRERFYWGNIVDVLQESKDNELNGKQSTGLNRKMKHFTFQDNFYDAIKLLDDKQSGQYIKAMCGYMFENKMPMLKPPTDGFFMLAKRKLDLSKTRKRNGSKGGKAERIPVTAEQVKKTDIMAGASIGMDGFLKYIRKSGMTYTNRVCSWQAVLIGRRSTMNCLIHRIGSAKACIKYCHIITK